MTVAPFTDYSVFAPKPKTSWYMKNARLRVNGEPLPGFHDFVLEGSFDAEAFTKIKPAEPRVDNAMTGVMSTLVTGTLDPIAYAELCGARQAHGQIYASDPEPIATLMTMLDSMDGGARLAERITLLPAKYDNWLHNVPIWRVEAWYL